MSDSFATGSVTSTTNNVGTAGLVGNAQNGTIKNCYATGRVNSTAGSGLIYGSATVTNSYFDSVTTNKVTPAAQARTTEQMASKETYIGWDFENIWSHQENSYPTLMNIVKSFDLTFHDLSSHSIIIEWPDILGATEYELHYSNKIERSTTAKMLITDLIPGTDYEFTVWAKIGNTKGVWSRTLKVRTKGASSVIDGLHSTSKDKSSITLTWNQVAGAESYEVIYNKKILRTETNTCKITGLYANIPYIIRVRALTADGRRIMSSPITEKIYTLNPQTEYAKTFIEKCEGQTWFIDEIENLLNLKGKSINTIKSRNDFATIYAIGLANRGISGKIPAAIGELYNLKYLYLANNNLSGKLPKELDSLNKLIKIDLSNNKFSN